MTTAMPLPPTGRRTGALWVAGTGAFLLVAAAAAFVAVHWSVLPATAKLALVVGSTAAALGGGRRLRRTLPATGEAIAHLGAFLVPVDVAAIGIRAGFGWREQLLAQSLVGTATAVALARAWGSTTLRRAATAGVVGLSAAGAAFTPVPAPLLLAAAAVAAVAVGTTTSRRAGVAWALAAGVAPAALAAAPAVWSTLHDARSTGSGVLVDLGLSGVAAGRWLAVSGLVAAATLAVEAGRRSSRTLAGAAAASAALATVAGLVAGDPTRDVRLLAPAGLFVLAELAAFLLRGHPSWRLPSAITATGVEVLAGMATTAAAAVVLLAPALDHGVLGSSPDATIAAACGLTAVGWLLAAARRPRSSLAAGVCGTVPAALWAAAAVTVGTHDAVAVALTVLAAGGLHVGLRLPLGRTTAAAFAPWAAVVVATRPTAGPLVALAGAAVLVAATRLPDAADEAGAGAAPALVGLGSLAAALTAAAGFEGAHRVGNPATLATVVAGLALLVLALPRPAVGAARWALVVATAVGLTVRPQDALVATLAAAAVLVVEAVLRSDGGPEVAAALAAQAVVVEVARIAGLDAAGVGAVLLVVALTAFGLGEVAPAPWRASLRTAALLGLVGLPLVATDPARLCEAAIALGLAGLVAGATRRDASFASTGAAVLAAGAAGRMLIGAVDVAEPYAALAAALLLGAGAWVRRADADRPASSWLAYAPAVAVLGGAAVAERLAGGPAWHALVAGAVGVAAVGAGGARRLVGPLLTGTALLVAVVGHELLSAGATVPTWAWLAAGGTTLLGLGVALERADTGPVEAGRRVADVLADRFE